jgi:heme exporter protein B
MNTVIALLYAALFESFIIQNFLLFFLSFIFGNIGLAISSTIIAAIIAKAGAKGTLYPVLSFPILLPLILSSVQLTLFALDGTTIEQAKFELAIVVSYDVVMLTVSYLLFDFIWKD